MNDVDRGKRVQELATELVELLAPYDDENHIGVVRYVENAPLEDWIIKVKKY